MRTYEDTFSGDRIYPGKGKLYVRGDSKIFRFQRGKTESLFLQRKNPRRIAWTTLFRRQHKKGISEVSGSEKVHIDCLEMFCDELPNGKGSVVRGHILRLTNHKLLGYMEIAKKRTRRTVKHQRAIVGASLDIIKERRTQRPEARAAARQAAIKEGKEKKTAAESKKKAEKAKSAAGAARGQLGKIQSKMGAKGAPNKVNAKSR
ncbi:60S ribosomal protein L24 [Hypocenomyce scalaris]|nr:60S ribosomal protein L24 [Hypocenomyce scalaris]